MSRDRHSHEPDVDGRTERSPARVRNDSERDLGSDSQPARSGDVRERPELDDSIRAYYLRDRSFLLRESEFATLVEIGKFRVIPADDLAQFGYAGDATRSNRDIRHLMQQELVAVKSLKSGGKQPEKLLVLTKKCPTCTTSALSDPGASAATRLRFARTVPHDCAHRSSNRPSPF